jgi:septum formation topological specificity factor MinE
MRVQGSDEFIKLLQQHFLEVLNNIVTVDESAVSFHTSETKRQSKHWVEKGQPGPMKA